MQLKYRGIAYQSSAPISEIIDTPETGMFLGARFNRKQYTAPQRQHLQKELTFLGRQYKG